MSICEKRGHNYFPTVRRATNWLTTTEENVIYCARCGNVKSLDVTNITVAQPYKSTPYGGWTYVTTTGTTSGWTFFNNVNDLGPNNMKV